jgi:hypothetical protein
MSFEAGAPAVVLFCASAIEAGAKTVCDTNSMGDKNCITASEKMEISLQKFHGLTKFLVTLSCPVNQLNIQSGA